MRSSIKSYGAGNRHIRQNEAWQKEVYMFWANLGLLDALWALGLVGGYTLLMSVWLSH